MLVPQYEARLNDRVGECEAIVSPSSRSGFGQCTAGSQIHFISHASGLMSSGGLLLGRSWGDAHAEAT